MAHKKILKRVNRAVQNFGAGFDTGIKNIISRRRKFVPREVQDSRDIGKQQRSFRHKFRGKAIEQAHRSRRKR